MKDIQDGKFDSLAAAKAQELLQSYRQGKTSVDLKATENQQWWRLRHWDAIAETNEGKKAGVSVGSAWTVNSLLNKHADIMDSFPKPNILPREAVDEQEAQILTNIVPVILDQNDYEEVYRTMGWDMCIDGAAITGVFWDTTKHDGLGDISVANIDVHNLFWQPGIENIQDSDAVFHVSLEDTEAVKEKYPNIADKIGPMDKGTVMKYMHDDNIDTTQCVEVVNMYYKKIIDEPVYMPGMDEMGQPTKVQIHTVPKPVVHMAILVEDQVAFCSENESEYANGFYEHGQYPFVIRRLFPIKDSPWGFGYLDIMKNPQKDIDKLDQAIIKNCQMKARRRYWVKKNGAIDKNEFADWNNELVEVGSGEIDANVKPIDTEALPGIVVNHLANKIDELKETSGNRDFSQGSTSSGVTAASAIAALQEAGSKLSRDINKELYRGSREEYYLVIELIRQFYKESRSFRVENEMGGYEFQEYSNENIANVPGQRKSIFDIKITAEKASPFSRAAQNETAKELYRLGLFHPENAIPALVCLDMMDFEGKDKIKQQVTNNATMLQQFNAAMTLIQQLSMASPQVAGAAMQMGLFSPEGLAEAETQQMMPGAVSDTQGTPEERAAKKETGNENTLVAKARQRAQKGAMPQ